MQLFWDQSVRAQRRPPHPRHVRLLQRVRTVTNGDIESNNVGLFVQDAWTVNRKLTLNLGMRAEREDVPSYRPDNPGVDFSFGDKIAPRVGFAYDVTGDSQWKVVRQLGRVLRPDEADDRPRHVRRRPLGQLLLHARHLRLAVDLSAATARRGSGCPGHVHQAVRLPSRRQQPDPPARRSGSQAGALAGVHARPRSRADPDDVGRRALRAQVGRLRDRGGLQLHAERRRGLRRQQSRLRQRARHLPARPQQSGAAAPRCATTTASRCGCASGSRTAGRPTPATSTAICAATGPASPARTKRSAACSRTRAGRSTCSTTRTTRSGNASIGRLGTDRPHQFKVQATYDLPWGTMVGVNALVESGVPQSTIMSQKNINFFPYGRGDLGRTPTFSQVDLLLQQDVPAAAQLRVVDRRQRHQPVRSEDGHALPDDAVSRRVQRRRRDVLRRVRSGGGGDRAELPARRALRHGQRLPGSKGDPAAGEVLVLEAITNA